MKKILITIVFILILIIPAYASEAPGYVVDLSTKGGYEAYVELVDLTNIQLVLPTVLNLQPTACILNTRMQMARSWRIQMDCRLYLQ